MKYKGRKLDAYKNAYFKKKRLDMSKENAQSDGKSIFQLYPSKYWVGIFPEEEIEKPTVVHHTGPKTVVKHNVLGCRSANQ